MTAISDNFNSENPDVAFLNYLINLTDRTPFQVTTPSNHKFVAKLKIGCGNFTLAIVRTDEFKVPHIVKLHGVVYSNLDLMEKEYSSWSLGLPRHRVEPTLEVENFESFPGIDQHKILLQEVIKQWALKARSFVSKERTQIILKTKCLTAEMDKIAEYLNRKSELERHEIEMQSFTKALLDKNPPKHENSTDDLNNGFDDPYDDLQGSFGPPQPVEQITEPPLSNVVQLIKAPPPPGVKSIPDSELEIEKPTKRRLLVVDGRKFESDVANESVRFISMMLEVFEKVQGPLTTVEMVKYMLRICGYKSDFIRATQEVLKYCYLGHEPKARRTIGVFRDSKKYYLWPFWWCKRDSSGEIRVNSRYVKNVNDHEWSSCLILTPKSTYLPETQSTTD